MCVCVCDGVGETLRNSPHVLLVIFLLMRGHSRGRKCSGTAAHSWLCVCVCVSLNVYPTTDCVCAEGLGCVCVCVLRIRDGGVKRGVTLAAGWGGGSWHAA